ncbi:MAG: FHA domain-containing protein [Pirellula sp.]
MNRIFLFQKPSVARPMPKPKILWIDGVGSYAMCDSDEVSVGQAYPGNDVDLAIRGDISRKACIIRRKGEDHLIQPFQTISIDGQNLERPAILRSGCILKIGDRVELRYTRPTLLSGTARLELVSSHRWQGVLSAAILLGDSLIIGPDPQSHVICQAPRGIDWQGRFVWFRQADGWMCKGVDCPGLAVGENPVSAPFKLETGLRVQSDVASWTLTDV